MSSSTRYQMMCGKDKLKNVHSMEESIEPIMSSSTSYDSLEAFKRQQKEKLVLLKDDEDGLEVEQIFEGALIGKKPFLFPLPVVLFFSSVFYLIATGQLIGTQ